eukprot:m.5627 g.5627  ORF g.5627 m.5627 type:complete len:50 (+) comp2528_c0_seq2:2794-2943(+)
MRALLSFLPSSCLRDLFFSTISVSASHHRLLLTARLFCLKNIVQYDQSK